MNKRFKFLSKPRSSMSIVFSTNGLYVVILSKAVRLKMLRGTKIFYGKASIDNQGWDNTHVLMLLRQWWEEEDDKMLLSKLQESPKGQIPLVRVNSQLLIDFNSAKEEFVKQLFED